MKLKTNLKFNEKGLIPAIVQDADTGQVLMLGYMNEAALKKTLSSGLPRNPATVAGLSSTPTALANRIARNKTLEKKLLTTTSVCA